MLMWSCYMRRSEQWIPTMKDSNARAPGTNFCITVRPALCQKNNNDVSTVKEISVGYSGKHSLRLAHPNSEK